MFFADRLQIFSLSAEDVSPVDDFLREEDPALMAISVSESAATDTRGQHPEISRGFTLAIWYR
jgi:hypothetical protein